MSNVFEMRPCIKCVHGTFVGRVYSRPTDKRPTIKLSNGQTDLRRVGDDYSASYRKLPKKDRSDSPLVEHPGLYARRVLGNWARSTLFKGARFYEVHPLGGTRELSRQDLAAMLKEPPRKSVAEETPNDPG